jgi:hypothetical protein
VRLPDPQRSRVALIGTSEYHDKEHLPDLPQVRQSVADFAALLTDAADGVVSADGCAVIVDEGDIRLIGRTLKAAAMQAEDLLLVYFAGHGLVGGRRHDLYLGLPDSEWDSPTSFNAIKYDDLRSAVLDSPAAAKVIILDCCFSGRAVTEAQAGSDEVLGQIEVEGTYVLTAAHRDQVAVIVPGEEHTAFTGRLLALLREGVSDGPELLTIDDLYKALLVRMTAEGLSHPQRRGTDTAGMLSLARNRAFTATAVPRLTARANSAWQHGVNGDWAGAARLLGDVADELERIVGPEDRATLGVRVMLAHALGGAGSPLNAVSMLRPLLAELSRVLVPDNALVLNARQSLAVNLGEAGYRDQAVEILRVLLPDRRRLLGGEDPETLRTTHMLARNLAAMGQASEATALLREVVVARERVLGADHPHTARAARDLAALQDPAT